MIATDSIIRGAEEIWRNYECARLKAYQARPGNPNRIAVSEFGNAVAALAPDVRHFNRVYGFSEEEIPLLPEIVAFYSDTRTDFELAVSALDANHVVGSALVTHGFSPGDYHTKFFADPAEVNALPADSNIVVSAVESGELESFLDIMLEGWGLPQSVWDAAKTNMRLRFGLPGVSICQGRNGGRPIGGGVLYCRGKDGYLADAATVPSGRNRGCHLVLIRARCAKAAALGCTRIFGCAGFGSSSFRNMQSAGLRIAYSDIVWRFSFSRT